MQFSDERRVLTYGTFDRFNADHVRFLRRAAHMGQRLIVGLASDEVLDVLRLKTHESYQDRRDMLTSCRYVDRVVTWSHTDQAHTDIVNYNVSLLVVDEPFGAIFNNLGDLAQVLHLTTTPTSTPVDRLDDSRVKLAHIA